MLSDGYHDVPNGKIAMVVTHLETYEPQVRSVPLPEGLAFDVLSRDPETYRDLFRRVGQDWLWYGRLRLTDADLAAVLGDENVHLFTLLKDGRPEAILELDFRQPEECELAYFGLTPALIGTGAGTYLMDRAQELAFKADIKRLHLHTCTLDSPQALAFYIRSGFKPYRRQVEIGDDPRLIGIYPKDTAPQVPILR